MKAPQMRPVTSKRSCTNLPKREELSLRLVLALPNASSSGLDSRTCDPRCSASQRGRPQAVESAERWSGTHRNRLTMSSKGAAAPLQVRCRRVRATRQDVVNGWKHTSSETHRCEPRRTCAPGQQNRTVASRCVRRRRGPSRAPGRQKRTAKTKGPKHRKGSPTCSSMGAASPWSEPRARKLEAGRASSSSGAPAPEAPSRCARPARYCITCRTSRTCQLVS